MSAKGKAAAYAVEGMRLWQLAAGLALAGGDFYCVDDLGIGGAATEIAGEIMPDLVVVGVGIAVEQLRRHQYEARGAVAALEGAGLDEGLLHRAQDIPAREMLDRPHLGAVDEGREIKAAGDGGAVDQHGAAAAHALAATLARAHQIEFALQQLDQIVMRLDRGRDLVAVESEIDGAAHHSSASGWPALARNARNTASGVSGSSVRRTLQASSMALAMAGDTQKVAVSPIPLAPNGPVGWWAATASFSITVGTSRMAGIL